jgi:hypothetical protein
VSSGGWCGSRPSPPLSCSPRTSTWSASCASSIGPGQHLKHAFPRAVEYIFINIKKFSNNKGTLQRKFHLCIPFLGIAWPNFHIHVSVSNLCVPRSVHIFSCSRIVRPILEILYKNLSQKYECRNWETEQHYNSGLETTVSLLGILKWEPDIYIGFSAAFHLQCRTGQGFFLNLKFYLDVL